MRSLEKSFEVCLLEKRDFKDETPYIDEKNPRKLIRFDGQIKLQALTLLQAPMVLQRIIFEVLGFLF